MSAEPWPPARLTAIDGLRGIAALAVVVYHYLQFFKFGSGGSPLPGGFVLMLLYEQGHRAVPLFWMISGLVLAHVYCAPGVTTREFVVNRFARLYPLHLLTLLVVAGLQVVALARLGAWPIYQHNDLWHFALNLLFASNWGFERGYSFNGPIWSVSVEILAYALFWALRGPLLRWGVALPLAVAAGAAATIVVAGDSDIARCLFYFFTGTALVALMRAFAGRARMIWTIALLLLAVACAALALKLSGTTQFVILPCLFGGAILALAQLRGAIRGGIGRACTLLGDWSYGIYLWHIPIQLALIVLLAPVIDLAALAARGWFMAAYLVLVLLVAHVSFVYFESSWRARLRRLGGGTDAMPSPASAAP